MPFPAPPTPPPHPFHFLLLFIISISRPHSTPQSIFFCHSIFLISPLFLLSFSLYLFPFNIYASISLPSFHKSPVIFFSIHSFLSVFKSLLVCLPLSPPSFHNSIVSLPPPPLSLSLSISLFFLFYCLSSQICANELQLCKQLWKKNVATNN